MHVGDAVPGWVTLTVKLYQVPSEKRQYGQSETDIDSVNVHVHISLSQQTNLSFEIINSQKSQGSLQP